MIINFILHEEIEAQTGDITHLWSEQQSLDWPKAAWASPKNRPPLWCQVQIRVH